MNENLSDRERNSDQFDFYRFVRCFKLPRFELLDGHDIAVSNYSEIP